jgi:hypothetical protein
MTVLEWLLDSDPAIRWQVFRDLVDAPEEAFAAERARTAIEGWGARLLALQGEDGQWAGGACFPARSFNWRDENQGQPWISTLPTLQLLHDFGVDPSSDRVSRAVELVRDHCRWEHAGQPFFSGEVEPCINGRTISLGIYFRQDMNHLVTPSWRAAEDGDERSGNGLSAGRLRPRSTSWKVCWHTSGQPRSPKSIAARHRGTVFPNENYFAGRVQAQSSTHPGCSSHFPPGGITTYCAPSNTSALSGILLV